MNNIANITYRKNPQYSERSAPDEPRLFAELDLSGYGIKKQVKALPVYYRKLAQPVGPIRVVYTTYIAGLILEAGNLFRLEQAIDETLKSIIRFERLPEFFFRVGDKAWPIYHLLDGLSTRYPGGPVFSTPDIASLRLWLADHFKSIGRIRNRREMDLLYLSDQDLQLYAPYCVLRTPDESVADIPIFPVKEKDRWFLMAPVDNQSFTVDYAGGKGIFNLFAQVGDYLIQRGQLQDLYEITIRKLGADAWENLECDMLPNPQRLTYEREMDSGLVTVENPTFLEERLYVAARTNRLGRVSLYLAPDMEDLCRRVASDLYSYGAIKDLNAVKAITPEMAQTPVM
ncbi:MAG: hypothetical protein IH586_00520 [Anaerolineaceae bacterium]|nr:hypothetical protein [Anaerolineaceae bacterium]